MPNFRILSDKTTLGSPGELVDSASHPAINFEALVEGGHIEPVLASKRTHTKEQD